MLFLDLEVYSDVSIQDVPLDVYANHPSTRINLACAVHGDIKTIGVWVEENMEEFFKLLRVYQGGFNAWNVGFERTILAAQGFPTPLSRWTDTMVMARQLGLPGGLKQCSAVPQIGMPEVAKTKSETLLIKKFCMPLTGKMKPGTPEEWAAFVDYCRRDVESTRHIYNYILQNFGEGPETERRVWELDQVINERGLPIDIASARHAAEEVVRLTGEAQQKLIALTGLANPNSVQQLSQWLKERGYPHDSLGKEFVQQALDREGDRLTPECYEVLSVRLSAAKASVKKFAAIVEGTSPDGRLRNQFKYYGAHTGRWSGRGAQPQNLPRTPTDEKELENLIRRGMIPTIDTLSSCIRPMIKAGPGKKLVVSDLSAIENRALMWLSGCDEGLKVYADGRDPYKDFAVRFFGIDYDAVSKHQRQICKPAVLGCGYGLGAGQQRELPNGRLTWTGLMAYASNMGVELDRMQAGDMVHTFRTAFYEVPEYWRYLEQAFHAAVKTGERQQVGAIYLGAVYGAGVARITGTGPGLNAISLRELKSLREIEAVYIELPSKRRLYYMNPRAWQGAKGVEIRFDGLRNGQWWSVSAWGGVLTENVVQAVSRDVLVEGMLLAEEAELTVVGHCHDELICEVDSNDRHALGNLEACMSDDISWAPGLPLAAEGWEGERYAKG